MNNETQQTAVDILCLNLAMKLDIPQAITFYIDHQEEIRQAKEMEKEQMIDFACDCSEMFRGQINVQYENTYGGNK
jgi:predicted transcriptional regulator YheO